jgi:hypothetical protein
MHKKIIQVLKGEEQKYDMVNLTSLEVPVQLCCVDLGWR